MLSREGSAERSQEIGERLTVIDRFSILRLNFTVRYFIALQSNLMVFLGGLK